LLVSHEAYLDTTIHERFRLGRTTGRGRVRRCLDEVDDRTTGKRDEPWPEKK